MDIAALVLWLITAGGGFGLLGIWLANGGLRQQEAGESRFPPALIFGHFLLAAAGLVVWIVFLVSDESAALAWTAFVLLLPVALLGFAMLARWWRDRSAAAGGSAAAVAAEQRFPLPVVVAHGALAVATLVLVLLSAIDVT